MLPVVPDLTETPGYLETSSDCARDPGLFKAGFAGWLPLVKSETCDFGNPEAEALDPRFAWLLG